MAGERKNPGLSGGPREISCAFEAIVQHCGSNGRDAVSSPRRPPHTLLLGHACVGDLIDAAFRAVDAEFVRDVSGRGQTLENPTPEPLCTPTVVAVIDRGR